MSNHKFFGEILIEEGKLTQKNLDNALALQKDNPTRKLGEILVTLEFIKFEDITDTLLAQYQETGETPEDASKWLSQDEIDGILKNMLGK
jgi:hypothetical protein